MSKMSNYFHNINMKLKIIINVCVLLCFSLIGLYGANYFYKQIIWIILGLLMSYLIYKLNVFKYSKYLYWFNLVLLLMVLFLGDEINGAKAWFNFKWFSFQPSELMKLSLILYLSLLVYNYQKSSLIKDLKLFFKLLILVLLPSILCFLEPDTGSIIIYFIIFITILLIIKFNPKILILFLIFLFLMFTFLITLYFTNQEIIVNLLGSNIFYRIDRLIYFKNNLQLENALIMISKSGLWGFRETELRLIEPYTDFIFSKIITKVGLIGATILIGNFMLLYLNLIKNLFIKTDKIVKISGILITITVLFSTIYNLMMNVGLVPIMGITLPFVSYGGSSLIITMISLGILLKS